MWTIGAERGQRLVASSRCPGSEMGERGSATLTNRIARKESRERAALTMSREGSGGEDGADEPEGRRTHRPLGELGETRLGQLEIGYAGEVRLLLLSGRRERTFWDRRWLLSVAFGWHVVEVQEGEGGAERRTAKCEGERGSGVLRKEWDAGISRTGSKV